MRAAMTRFRAVVPLALFLVLAGCIGGAKNASVQKESTPGAVPDPAAVVAKQIVKPLAVSFTQTEDWVLPGTTVSFAATPVAGGSGTLTYRWQYGDQLPMRMGDENQPHMHMTGGMDTGNVAAGAAKALTFP